MTQPRLRASESAPRICLPRGSAVIDRLMFRTALLPNGCWEWRGARNPKGYGNIRVDSYGPAKSTHRVAYVELVGPVPVGMEIDDLCRNRACINPGHLQVVDHATDQRKTVCKNGHRMDAENTRLYVTPQGYEGRACRACARDFTRQYRARKASK